MLVIFNEKGNVFEQCPCPYFIGRIGKMNTILKENRFLRVARSTVSIKKTTTSLNGKGFNVAVEVGDCVIGHMRKLHRKQAVDQDFRHREVVVELYEYGFQGIDVIKVTVEDIIGTNH